jgi:hypothetical protein
VGLDGAEAISADEYLDRLHAADFDLFCEICIVGREVAWQMTPWQPPDDQLNRVAER